MGSPELISIALKLDKQCFILLSEACSEREVSESREMDPHACSSYSYPRVKPHHGQQSGSLSPSGGLPQTKKSE